MTATPAAPAPRAGQASTLHLSELLRRPVTDRGGESIGRLSDVIVRLRGGDLPLVTGLVAAVGGRELYLPIGRISMAERATRFKLANASSTSASSSAERARCCSGTTSSATG